MPFYCIGIGWCAVKKAKHLQIGKIVNTHGVRGELKVIPLTDDSDRFYDLDWVFVGDEAELVKYEIEYVKLVKNFVLLKLKGIDDMDWAARLKNLYVLVDRTNAVKLPEDTFFICDIIDSTVYDENGKRLGILKDVLKTGSNDVYVVKDDSNKDILIPALKTVVKKVSVTEGKIIVKLPEGLIDNEI